MELRACMLSVEIIPIWYIGLEVWSQKSKMIFFGMQVYILCKRGTKSTYFFYSFCKECCILHKHPLHLIWRYFNISFKYKRKHIIYSQNELVISRRKTNKSRQWVLCLWQRDKTVKFVPQRLRFVSLHVHSHNLSVVSQTMV